MSSGLNDCSCFQGLLNVVAQRHSCRGGQQHGFLLSCTFVVLGETLLPLQPPQEFLSWFFQPTVKGGSICVVFAWWTGVSMAQDPRPCLRGTGVTACPTSPWFLSTLRAHQSCVCALPASAKCQGCHPGALGFNWQKMKFSLDAGL